MSIKDYLKLKKIYNYLQDEIDKLYQETEGYSNEYIDKLIFMKNDLKEILNKLENADDKQ